MGRLAVWGVERIRGPQLRTKTVTTGQGRSNRNKSIVEQNVEHAHRWARGRDATMRLEEQLAELLAGLGVVLEGQSEELARKPEQSAESADGAEREAPVRYSFGTRRQRDDAGATEDDGADELEANIAAVAEVSLFQTSREHYGVFYRLDLVAGAPQLRIFAPAEDGPVKVRCYLVCA